MLPANLAKALLARIKTVLGCTNGSRVAIALSGGPDSMALARLAAACTDVS